MPRLLVVTAVDAEAEAIGSHDDVDLLVAGAGPVAAAVATAAALARASYDLVLSAGIGGGFAPLRPGDLAVASEVAFADLGAETAEGFVPIGKLGFAPEARYAVDPSLTALLCGETGAHRGSILTVATVTGTADTAAELLRRYPSAIAEAMEGFGVAAAAARFGTRFAEIRAISNLVGPRDRDAWRIGDALARLRTTMPGVIRAVAELIR